MLSSYHLQFLQTLTGNGARFIIIGGMARWHYYGTLTRDLDVLVDIEQSRSATEQALASWKRKYAIHTLLDLTPPLALRPLVQIKFPDDICFYQDHEGNTLEITPEDGIDVLTSLPGAEFDSLQARSEMAEYDGLSLCFLGPADLSNAPHSKIAPFL